MNKISQKIEEYKKLLELIDKETTDVAIAKEIGIAPSTLCQLKKDPSTASKTSIKKLCAKYGGMFGGLSFEDFIE